MTRSRARNGTFVGRSRNRSARGYCNSNWSNYWTGGWPGSSYYYSSGWYDNWGITFGLGAFGVNSFCWNYGLLHPYNAYQASYWHNRYSYCHWNSWSSPYSVASTYWWYPQSTYCPTYLITPSIVTYQDQVADEELVVFETEDGAAGAGSTERVVAGRGVVGKARSTEHSAESTLAESYVDLGDMYFLAGRYDDSAEAYSKARDNAPEDASIHLVLADAVFANRDYHYAAFLIGEAVRLDPEIVTAEANKRDFYADPTDFDKQLETLQNYCSEKPYDAWARLVLGYNLHFSGQPVRAMAAFRRVVELDRDNATAAAFLAQAVSASKEDR